MFIFCQIVYPALIAVSTKEENAFGLKSEGQTSRRPGKGGKEPGRVEEGQDISGMG